MYEKNHTHHYTLLFFTYKIFPINNKIYIKCITLNPCTIRYNERFIYFLQCILTNLGLLVCKYVKFWTHFKFWKKDLYPAELG